MKDKIAGRIGEDREQNRIRIAAVLVEAGRNYEEKGVAELQIYQDDDVHAFYRLAADSSRVVHVQAYPDSSEVMVVTPRIVDYEDRMEFLSGEEERLTFSIPYEAKALEELLAKEVPELGLE